MSSDGVVVFSFGPAPINFLSNASALCGKDAILDTSAARMAGASFAMGSPAALAALKAKLEDGALAAERAANPGLSPEATAWLACGERGVSSNTIFEHLTGISAVGEWGAATRTTRATSAAAACCSSACRIWSRCSRGWQKSRRSGRRWSLDGTACAPRWTPSARIGEPAAEALRRRPTR